MAKQIARMNPERDPKMMPKRILQPRVLNVGVLEGDEGACATIRLRWFKGEVFDVSLHSRDWKRHKRKRIWGKIRAVCVKQNLGFVTAMLEESKHSKTPTAASKT